MVNHRLLAELEEAQDEERATARARIETAETYLDQYRSRIEQVREAFHGLATHGGVADDPVFRERLQSVGETSAENIAHAGRKIGELEEEYDAMLHEHDAQRERLLAARVDDR
jgi:hypothetical protein